MGSKVLLYYFCHVKESAYSQSDLFRYEDKMKEMKKLKLDPNKVDLLTSEGGLDDLVIADDSDPLNRFKLR